MPQRVSQLAQVSALFLYWHNTEPEELMRQVYTDPAPSYIDEKMKIWSLGITTFFGQLDNYHRWKLVQAAWAKYGEESTRHILADPDFYTPPTSKSAFDYLTALPRRNVT